MSLYYRRRSRTNGLILFALILGGIFASIWIYNGRHSDPTINIWREDTQEMMKMRLEDYVAGVVAAEMPASFNMEALKAQAVAARTYAMYHIRSGRQIPGHPEAVLTTDYRTGQAWVDRGSLRKRWGFWGYFKNWRRITRAVNSTEGLVITKGGNPIQALYHSTSGGATEASENYWGNYVDYLRSVPSPWEEDSPFWYSEAVLTQQEIAGKLGVDYELLSSSTGDEGAPDVEIFSVFASGRVKEARLFGKTYSGREVRQALGLRSTFFRIRQENGVVIFEVRGNGHGVGMSQYGANGLASKGYTFKEILAHYYTSVSLSADYCGYWR